MNPSTDRRITVNSAISVIGFILGLTTLTLPHMGSVENTQIAASKAALVFFNQSAVVAGRKSGSDVDTYPVGKEDEFLPSAATTEWQEKLKVTLNTSSDTGADALFLRLTRYWNMLAHTLYEMNPAENYQAIPSPNITAKNVPPEVQSLMNSTETDLQRASPSTLSYPRKMDVVAGAATRTTDKLVEIYSSETALPLREARLEALHKVRNALVCIQYRKGALPLARLICGFLYALVMIPTIWYWTVTCKAISVGIEQTPNDGWGVFLRHTFSVMNAILLAITIFLWKVYVLTATLSLAHLYALQLIIVFSILLLADICIRQGSHRYSTLHSFIRLLLHFGSFYLVFFCVWFILMWQSDFTVGSSASLFSLSELARLNVSALFFFSACVIFGFQLWSPGKRKWAFACFVGGALFLFSLCFNQIAESTFPRNVFYWALPFGAQRAIWIEVVASRFFFAVPLAILVIWKAVKRHRESVALTNYLSITSSGAPYGFEIPVFGQARLSPIGDLTVSLFRGSPDAPFAQNTFTTEQSASSKTGGAGRSEDNSFSQIAGMHWLLGVLIYARLVVRAMRPANVCLAMCMSLFSYAYAFNWHFSWITAALVALSIGIMVGAQMLLNDCMDIDIDRVNRPTRLVASGQIPHQQGMRVALTLCFIALALAWFVSRSFYLYIAGAAVLCFIYSVWLKRRCAWLANVLSAVLTASLCLTGVILGGHMHEFFFLSAAALFACLAREVAKDVEDAEGDTDKRKLAVWMIVGKQRALFLGAICVLLQILASYLPLVFCGYGGIYAVLISVANLMLIVGMFGSRGLTQVAQATRIQRACKFSMLLYLCAFAAGAVM